MTDTVAATTGATVTSPIVERYRPPKAEPTASELDKDAFLKLLVAQLKYQDPLQPTTNEDFIATTAQFTAVEKLDQLTQQAASSAVVNALMTAGALLGRSITANRDGVTVTATVQRSEISAGEVVLVTDQGAIRLDEIVGIGPAEPSGTDQNTDQQGGAQP